MPLQDDFLEEYLNMLEILTDAPIESGTTNPFFIQRSDFPGPFLEQNSPVRDIYEYEKIINEDENANNNTTDEEDDTTTTSGQRSGGSAAGY